MSDLVIDSCVIAKWVLPEPDEDKAMHLLAKAATAGDRLYLYVVDIALAEVTNAIWKRWRRGLTSLDDAKVFVQALGAFPLSREPSAPLVSSAFEIAAKYDRSAYDSLFLALVQKLGVSGVTADEPLFNATRADFPQVSLLRLL